MGTLGFTGTRSFTSAHLRQLEPLNLSYFDTFITGACRGFDAVIGIRLTALYPTARHIVIVPDNRSQVDNWWEGLPKGFGVEVVEMPKHSTYKDRNQEIVNRADSLFFCAKAPESAGVSQRSGTWQTVRMARRKGIPVNGYLLSTGVRNG